MLIKDLQKAIRDITKVINNRINQYFISGESDKLFEKYIDVVKRAAGVKGTKNKPVGLGFKGKKKSDLETQLSKLERFLEYDDITPDARQERKEKTIRAYNTFTSNYPEYSSMSFNEYIDLVEDLNTLGDDVLGKFDYRAVISEYASQLRTGKKIDLVKVVRQAQKNAVTTRDFVDNAISIMRNEIK